MSENLGRSKIRNWLGKAAYFEYILFLDGDSTIKSKDFIKIILLHYQQKRLYTEV
ncbi:MAG: glycosyltransferase family 2 protein [Saprospiraceae bacterium]|nr:glycosyltransferase family 2 protein [Saprospiraceae bacterium]